MINDNFKYYREIMSKVHLFMKDFASMIEYYYTILIYVHNLRRLQSQRLIR